MKVLITGATGLVGKSVGLELAIQGHEVFVISRREEVDLPFKCRVIKGDLSKSPIDELKQIEFDVVLHFMGETVAQRWTEEAKQRILSSRIDSARHLIESLGSAKTLISASATGYFGDTGESEVDESNLQGEGFLAEVCKEWEAEFFSKKNQSRFLQSRFLAARFGVVLSDQGGMLERLRPIFSRGLGGKLGSGQQWMSWIHLKDLVRGIMYLISKPELSGTFNFTSPEPAKNREFTKLLAERFNRWSFFSVPKVALDLAMGEMARMLLESQRVLPKRLSDSGFQFLFSNLRIALEDIYPEDNKGIQTKRFQTLLSGSLDQVFHFFSSEKNLEVLTPEFLNFKVQGMSTPEIQTGTFIDYTLKIHGVPVTWKTEILDWKVNQSFVDIQRKGPYRCWHHTHKFEECKGGILMSDTVRWALPLSPLSNFVVDEFVDKDVENIFSYRQKKIMKMF